MTSRLKVPALAQQALPPWTLEEEVAFFGSLRALEAERWQHVYNATTRDERIEAWVAWKVWEDVPENDTLVAWREADNRHLFVTRMADRLRDQYPVLRVLQRKIAACESEAIRRHISYVIVQAKRVHGNTQRRDSDGQVLEDRIQEGTIGLQRALRDYEPERGFRFLTYASNWIKQRMWRASYNSDLLRLPVYLHTFQMRVGRIRRKHYRLHGRHLDETQIEQELKEISASGGLSDERLLALRGELPTLVNPSVKTKADVAAHLARIRGAEIPAFMEAGGSEVYVQPDHEEDLYTKDPLLMRNVRRALPQIQDLHRQVLELRFPSDPFTAPLTHQQVGDRLGRSKQWSLLTERRVVAWLRNQCGCPEKEGGAVEPPKPYPFLHGQGKSPSSHAALKQHHTQRVEQWRAARAAKAASKPSTEAA